MGANGRLVVAIHDVAPSAVGEVRYLLGALDNIGVRPRVLKVIPNADGRDDIRHHPALTRLLADEAAASSEVLLHGYTHRAAGALRGPWPTRARARLFAGAAAEFLTLDNDEMTDRLAAGRRILRDCGLDPRGFGAPCWLAPPGLPTLLRQSGFAYYVTMMTLLDLTTGRRVLTPSLGYMGAGAGQERLIGLGAAAGLAAAPWLPIVKVFLHPQGAGASPACDRTLRMLACLARTRSLVTYGDLLAR